MIEFIVDNLSFNLSNQDVSYRGNCEEVNFNPPGFPVDRVKLDLIRTMKWGVWVKDGVDKSRAFISYVEGFECCEVQIFLSSEQFVKFQRIAEMKLLNKNLSLEVYISDTGNWVEETGRYGLLEETSFEQFLEGRSYVRENFHFRLA